MDKKYVRDLQRGDVIRSAQFAQAFYLCEAGDRFTPRIYFDPNHLPFSERIFKGQPAAPANDPSRADRWYMVEKAVKHASSDAIQIVAVGLDRRLKPDPERRGRIILDLTDDVPRNSVADYWGTMDRECTQIVYTLMDQPEPPERLEAPKSGPYR